MHGMLHALGTIVALPYALMAGAFLLVGEVARSRGMRGVVSVLFSHADWMVRWGIYLIPVLYLALALAGFVPGLRRPSALCLMVLSAASLLSIVILHSGKLGLGEGLFLLPCVGVVAVSAWLYVRAGQHALWQGP